MKTKKFSLWQIWTVSLLFVFLCTGLRAQISCSGTYTIQNNAGCTILVGYRFLCNGSACDSNPFITITNGNQHVITPPAACTSCSGNCDVQVTLKSMGGTPLLPSPVTVSSGNTSASFAPPASCPTSAGTMTWTTTQTNIN
jgi:hypothetical protein